MIAGADIGIDAKALADDALAITDQLLDGRCNAPLAIQLTLAFGNDDFRSGELGEQRFAQHAHRLLHVVGANGAHPFNAHAAHRGLDAVSRQPALDLGRR